MTSKKVVVKLDLHDDKDKQKAMRVVAKIPHVDSITIDMKDRKLTAVGDIDPVTVVNRLRKHWIADIFSVGPAKEPEKKKDDGKKDDGDKKKDDGKKDGGGGGDKKKDNQNQMPAYNPYMPYYPPIVTYNPHMNYAQHAPPNYPSHYPHMPSSSPYYVQHEENPNGCVIS